MKDCFLMFSYVRCLSLTELKVWMCIFTVKRRKGKPAGFAVECRNCRDWGDCWRFLHSQKATDQTQIIKRISAAQLLGYCFWIMTWDSLFLDPHNYHQQYSCSVLGTQNGIPQLQFQLWPSRNAQNLRSLSADPEVFSGRPSCNAAGNHSRRCWGALAARQNMEYPFVRLAEVTNLSTFKSWMHPLIWNNHSDEDSSITFTHEELRA